MIALAWSLAILLAASTRGFASLNSSSALITTSTLTSTSTLISPTTNSSTLISSSTTLSTLISSTTNSSTLISSTTITSTPVSSSTTSPTFPTVSPSSKATPTHPSYPDLPDDPASSGEFLTYIEPGPPQNGEILPLYPGAPDTYWQFAEFIAYNANNSTCADTAFSGVSVNALFSATPSPLYSYPVANGWKQCYAPITAPQVLVAINYCSNHLNAADSATGCCTMYWKGQYLGLSLRLAVDLNPDWPEVKCNDTMPPKLAAYQEPEGVRFGGSSF